MGFWTYRTPPYVRAAPIFHPPGKPRRYLSPAYFENTNVSARDRDKDAEKTAIYKYWTDLPFGHKFLHYFPVYQEVIEYFRDQPIRMLEIGVQNGASVRMWRHMLHKGSTVVGIDIDESCARFESAKENLFIRIGDQSDPLFLERVCEEFGPFDFILDDGSHMCSHMIASFNCLYLDHLRNCGIYFAEDAQANYWQYWRDQSYSFVDLAKDLVDYMHAHYKKGDLDSFMVGHPARKSSLSVPKICTQIKEIRFRDSLVLIYKGAIAHLPICVYGGDNINAQRTTAE